MVVLSDLRTLVIGSRYTIKLCPGGLRIFGTVLRVLPDLDNLRWGTIYTDNGQVSAGFGSWLEVEEYRESTVADSKDKKTIKIYETAVKDIKKHPSVSKAIVTIIEEAEAAIKLL